MRALTLLLMGTLFRSATLGAPASPKTSTLTPRSKFCANAPNTVAGTLLDRRTRPWNHFTLRIPGPELNAVLWCTPHSATYLVVTVVSSNIVSKVILDLIDDAFTNIQSHIVLYGDSVLPDGSFFWKGQNGLNLSTFNSDNHQQTWGVLGAALFALGDFMTHIGPFAGRCYFTIIDGNNIVGRGAIS